MVPYLTTALTGPLLELEKRLLDAQPTIEHWFRQQWKVQAAPFYTSVDIRNAGFKLAPVDTNLFPGGFNNLNPAFMSLSIHAAMGAVEKICPYAQRLLLIPESHTRNTFYLQNVAVLAHILRQTGLIVRIGTLIPEITQPTTLELPAGGRLTLEPLVRTGDRIGLEGFDPCAVLLNNDLSAGVPDILKGIEQNIMPPLHAGWATRRKSRHFAAYEHVADRIRTADRHRSLADRSLLRPVRQDRLPGAPGRRLPGRKGRRHAGENPRQIRRIRHRPAALRHRQGRRRHLRHGHHDGEVGGRRARTQPQAAQQDGGRQGRHWRSARC
jgi:hypothetical protein